MDSIRQFSSNISRIIDIAEKAGKAIMEIYSQNDFSTTYKDDNSPLTRADIASNKVIKESLEALEPKLPILSEEAKDISYEDRRSWKSYWLIDPLDGTKEFIKKNGEFTVNIALVVNAMPFLGVVHAPSFSVTYYASKGKGAFKKTVNKQIEKINVDSYKKGTLKIVASRSHKGEKLEGFIKDIGSKMREVEYINMGSSLKLCLVAEGIAHLYPRLNPTMEWDTAAAQCIVEEAGGMVVDMAGNQIRYNKESLLNDDFLVLSSVELFNSIISVRP
jgi:3'(2'), 5'-bisphosphate nucleotidase